MISHVTSMLIGLLLSISTALGAVGAAGAQIIQANNANKGTITVAAPQTDTAIAVMVDKNGKRSTYKMASGAQASFALLHGDGSYTVQVLEQVNGNKYRVLNKQVVDATIESEQAPFLNAVQEVNFDKNSIAVAKAAELVDDSKSDAAKVKAIHTFVVNHVKYDFDKADTVANSYLPDVDKTFNSGYGICYDYAALTAAMLRSQGVATKLVKGYVEGLDVYHAWNEVWVDGQWKVIDTTLDASEVQSGNAVTVFKDASLYTIKSAT